MRRPFSFFSISVILGIILGYSLSLKIDGYLFSLLMIVMILATIFYQKRALIFICFSLILVGNFMFNNYMESSTVLKEYPFEKLALEVEIKRVGIDQGRYVEYDVDILSLIKTDGESTINEKARLQLKYANDLPVALEPFDMVTLRNVTLIEDFDKRGLEGYQLYLRGRGFKSILQVNAKDLMKVDKYVTTNIINSSFKTRRYIEDFFDQSLPSIESSMLKSIMFGNQGYLDKETLNLFSISGTAHIIAVSGLHVGVMVLLCHHLLAFLNLGKRKILLITMVTLFFYSAIVGFPVSIIRASSMYCLYVLGYFVERRYDAINSLMMMAFLLLLYNPLNIFSVSFQLSFAATLSILLFFPFVKDLLKVVPKYLQSLMAVTIAAQLGTIPIMIYHFNQLSFIAFIANIFIVPTLMPLLFTSLTSVFVSMFSNSLGLIINYLTHGLLAYIYWMVQRLSNLSIASIAVEGLRIYHMMGYYFILFAVYFILWHNKSR
ncbi:competence protein ComEC [Anaerovirgula multivorans]|uniref:Competence protein ComEC n=1 Tax=Anaerovirgula multivorans TaxID=312168 RepID=A0A239KDT1_9FIRM|nr:ComEC/Rec2 family competence protein [Anaerovirgula multivorans]SNT15254.1 competence protein ComEC [Anaerovirgula multivorans]